MYQRKDAYYTRAKRAGYRSRAAYKLEELNRQFKLLRRGDRVVDLGAWPGGWLQVAGDLVGERGKVVGIDLQAIDPFPGRSQIATLKADITDPALQDKLAEMLGGKADIVLSDLAPKLSGVRDRDVAAAMQLAAIAVAAAARLLRPGGGLVMKLFMSDQTAAFVDELRRQFAEVRITRPDATRKGSAEIYAIAKGFRATV